MQHKKHEVKACPRCGQAFECKAGDILKCQCFGVQLSELQQKFVADQYEDCLCRNCLLNIQNQKENFS